MVRKYRCGKFVVNGIMKISFTWIPASELENTGIDPHWIACIDDMPGMVVSGTTREDAFNELMVSLRVKFAFDNNIDITK